VDPRVRKRFQEVEIFGVIAIEYVSQDSGVGVMRVRSSFLAMVPRQEFLFQNLAHRSVVG
jgi:hypothetical protein